MLSVSGLVDILARVTDMPEDMISRIARRLIDASILPKSRGRSIAGVTSLHAFQLLIACAATDKPSEAPEIVKLYSDMTLMGGYTAEYKNFGDEGALLIKEACNFNPEVWRALTYGYVRVRRHFPGGSIKEGGGQEVDYLPQDFDLRPVPTRVQIEARIPGDVLLHIAAGLKEMTYPEALHLAKAAQTKC